MPNKWVYQKWFVASCKQHWEVAQVSPQTRPSHFEQYSISPKHLLKNNRDSAQHQLQPPLFHQFSKKSQDFRIIYQESSLFQSFTSIRSSNHVSYSSKSFSQQFPTFFHPFSHMVPAFSHIFPSISHPKKSAAPSPGAGRRCAPRARWRRAEGPAPGLDGRGWSLVSSKMVTIWRLPYISGWLIYIYILMDDYMDDYMDD